MIKLQVFLSLLIVLFSYTLWAQPKVKVTEIDMIKLDFEVLSAKKSQVESKEPVLMDAYKQLLTEANKSLKFKAVSVVNKKQLPPSGSKNDYMSIAPYWWPDLSKPDGMPYIRKDGETNPEVKEYSDKENMPKMCKNVYTLALAFYFSGDEKYAQHAAELVRVFFLDSNTKMNPNLNFGQSIKGITNGRAAGIIDVRHFIFLLDGIQLLKQSKHFDEKEYIALSEWFKEFLSWLRTSQIGQDEGAAENNHGVWYDALCLSISNFTGDDRLSKVIIQNAADRLDVQMDDRGLFPHELKRTISLHYSIFVLDAFYTIAQLSEENNFDFWHLETKSKKSLKKAYETLLPFFSGAQAWEWPQIKPYTMSKANFIFSKAISKYNCIECKDVIKKHSHRQKKSLLNLL